MSSTTQILFNSPALHSLKREQLLKLCKIHEIKATGKNAELIERLKQHALTLPRDAPLSIAARSENASLPPHTRERLFSESDQSWPSYERPRPSGQLDVVMDSIEETDETSSSQGTLTSLKTTGKDKSASEFGTGGTKSSVSSSLKALATSLGLKRSGVVSSSSTALPSSMESHPPASDIEIQRTDKLTQLATPYNQLPPATSVPSDNLHGDLHGSIADVNMEEPVPGHVLRPGVPIPPNARLSLGQGPTAPHTPSKRPQPTTTIRLVAHHHGDEAPQGPGNSSPSTPLLTPFKTSFDLIMSPRMATGIGFGTFSSATTWSSENTSIYPALPTDTSEPSTHEVPPVNNVVANVVDADGDITMPGAFSCSALPGRSTNNATDATTIPPSAVSPVSGTLMPPADPFIFGSPLPKHRTSDVQFRDAAASILEEMNKRLQAEGVGEVDADIIKRLHPGTHATPLPAVGDQAAGGINQRQPNEIKEIFNKKHDAEFAKMEGIDALVRRKAAKLSGQAKDDRVIIGKKRRSDALADESRRLPSQVAGRTSGTRVISNGRRSKMIPGAFDDECYDHEPEADEGREKKKVKVENSGVSEHDAEAGEQKREKEREAIRRKLEASKAKRRSSAAAGRQSGRVSIGRIQQKQKPSRFGFLAQAKSIVQSVFGRSKTPKTGTSTVAAPTTSSKAKAEKQEPEHVPKKLSKVSSAKNPGNASRPTESNARSANSKASLERQASGTLDKDQQSLPSAHSRSPIPPFNGSMSPATVARVKKLSTSSAHSRGDSGSSSDNSTLGSKSSSTKSKIPSTSARKSPASTSSAVGSLGVKKVPERSQASLSRLHAPTASSLAKMNDRMPASLTKVSLPESKHIGNMSSDKKETTLSPITNKVVHGLTFKQGIKSPPTSQKIFSKPLKSSAYQSGSAGGADDDDDAKAGTESASSANDKQPLERQRTLSSRKPRISRSKVISRLASQRATGTKGSEPAKSGTSRSSATGKLSTPRVRSSLSAKANNPLGRRSHTGVRVCSGGSDLMMSAKKRVRQSEYYARRRSRAGSTKLSNAPA